MQHTPGPWTLQRKATNHQHLLGPGPGLIADIHRDEDAVLIAACPDLIAALNYARHVMEGNGLHRNTEWHTGYPKLWADINAALSKAGAFK